MSFNLHEFQSRYAGLDLEVDVEQFQDLLELRIDTDVPLDDRLPQIKSDIIECFSDFNKFEVWIDYHTRVKRSSDLYPNLGEITIHDDAFHEILLKFNRKDDHEISSHQSQHLHSSD